MADITIEQVREKFPQYKDLSDEQLAQGLHKKYYADMPFEDFAKKIGYSAVKGRSEVVPEYPKINPLTRKPKAMTESESQAASTGAYQGMAGSLAGGALTDVLNIPSGLFNIGARLAEKYAGKPEGSSLRAPTLPSSADISSYLFGPATGAQQRGREFGGVLGSFALGSTVPKLVGSIVSGGSKLVSTALGRPLRAAEETLISKVQSLGESRINELSAEEKATLSNLASEQAAAEQKLASETERKAVAEKAGEKAKGAEERAVLGLKGTRVGEEFGERAILPMTKQKLGEDVRSLVTNFVDSIKSIRKTKADQEFAKAFSSAAEKEFAGVPFISNKKMSDLKKFLDDRLEQTTDESIARNLKRIRSALFEGRIEGDKVVAAPSFKSAEDIRRLLGDAVSGVTAEGYEAIGQNLARDIYGKLSDAMKDFSPGFDKYLARYKDLSQTIEGAGTKLGKAVIGEEKTAPGFYNVSADKLVDRVFSSPESIRTFTEAVGGNRQPVEALAERYLSNQLATKSTEEARKFLTSDKTRAILEELGPEFRSRIETRYFTKATEQSRIAEAAKGVVSESEKAIDDLTKQIKDITKTVETTKENLSALQSKVNTGLERIRLAVSDSDRVQNATALLSDLKSTMPPEIYAEAENLVTKVKEAADRRSQANKFLLKGAGLVGVGGLASYFGLPKVIGGQ